MSINKDDLQGLVGAAVIGADGDKIGDVSQFYLSDRTGEPTWATVKTGLFGAQESFVPLNGSSVQPGELRVAFDKAALRDAPRIDTDGHLTPEEEDHLYQYYGMTEEQNRDVRDAEDRNQHVLGQTDAADKDHGTPKADESSLGADRDATTSPARTSLDSAENRDQVGDHDHDHDPDDRELEIDPSRRDDRDWDRDGDDVDSPGGDEERNTDLEAVTAGETRTRMRRYVVTEHVTQTIEELPGDDGRP